jgi:hypothetical protein
MRTIIDAKAGAQLWTGPLAALIARLRDSNDHESRVRFEHSEIQRRADVSLKRVLE